MVPLKTPWDTGFSSHVQGSGWEAGALDALKVVQVRSRVYLPCRAPGGQAETFLGGTCPCGLLQKAHGCRKFFKSLTHVFYSNESDAAHGQAAHEGRIWEGQGKGMAVPVGWGR